ncbi:tetratricopeptide repeat protein [uncultured Microbulbifer sp.]|mgnify:CR=1 FL=1|uniref:tetratricopeptide repeat protein n=1 Tax=uncultured Microbulbifer sp. TaxID=348147 RepID=UPI0025E188C7|nr:tetratricopeptide repeat protein [uncultured Microbulbifer sp.]
MRLTDIRSLKSGATVVALVSLLFAGCAGNPPAPETTGNLDENGQHIPVPNPYLVQPGSVPAAAQKALANARNLFQQQQFAAAEAELLQVVEQWPQLSGAWLNLAKVQLKLEKAEQAESSLQQAVAANEDNVFAWNTLGVLLRDQGRFEEAQGAYENALQRWPDFVAAHRNLGILFDLYLHEPEQALQHYRAAQALQTEEDRVLAGWIVDLERRM